MLHTFLRFSSTSAMVGDFMFPRKSGFREWKHKILIWLPSSDKTKLETWSCHRGSTIPTKRLEGDESSSRGFVVWHPGEYYRLFWELCGSSLLLQNRFELWSVSLPGIALPLQFIILSEPVKTFTAGSKIHRFANKPNIVHVAVVYFELFLTYCCKTKIILLFLRAKTWTETATHFKPVKPCAPC